MENSNNMLVCVLVASPARLSQVGTEVLGVFTSAEKAKEYKDSIADEYPEHVLEIHILALQ